MRKRSRSGRIRETAVGESRLPIVRDVAFEPEERKAKSPVESSRLPRYGI